MGIFKRLVKYLKDAYSDNGTADAKKQYKGDTEDAYRCSVCGRHPLSGPVLYCPGCGQYMCYAHGVASGEENAWDCPNCAIRCQQATL
jgi:hypothetical protein